MSAVKGAKRGPVSAETRAKIAAATRARWARVKAGELPKPEVGARKRWTEGGGSRPVSANGAANPLIVRCAWCRWTAEGLGTEAIAAQRAHASEMHGITYERRAELRRSR